LYARFSPKLKARCALRPSTSVLAIFLLVALTVGAFAQTFNSPTLLPTAFDPVSVASGDFNRDGKVDLVYVDGAGQNNHTLHVLVGRGNGTFSHGQDILLPTGICFGCTINVADVTGDGIVDLILEGNNTVTGSVAVLPGAGDGTFLTPIISTLTPNAAGFSLLRGVMAVADFNGDGFADLAVSDPTQGGGIHILLGNNTGSFVESSILFDNSSSSDLHAVDLNHDGHIDLVALGGIASGGFNTFLGNGDGTFQPAVLHEIAAGFKGYLTDLDGDGQPDVLAEITPTFNVRQLVFIKGNPDGTFNAPLQIGSLPFDVNTASIGDFNGDGRVDLVLNTLNGVGIMPGLPGLAFGPIVTSLSASISGNSLVGAPPVQADLNGDGHLDLAVATDGGIEVLLGNGDGSFASGAQLFIVGNPIAAIAVADFTGDRIPDIAVAVDAAIPRLLVGQPGGNFVLAPDPNTTHGTGPTSLAVGDFNGDGNLDLSLGQISFVVSPTLVFGDGRGNFSAPLNVPTGSKDVADFNHDVHSDMAVVPSCFTDCQVTVSLGQTTNTFITQQTTLLGINHANITAIGDLNGDGIADLVTTGDGVLEVWLGKGDGTFTQGVRVDISSFIGSGTGPGTGSAAIVDLDGDGRNDVVLAPRSFTTSLFFPAPQAFMVFYALGNGTFEPPVLVPLSHYYFNLTVADLNRDGRPDLIFNDQAGIAVVMNLGGRKFDAESHYIAGPAIATLVAADVDGDGFPDLVVANPGGQAVAVLRNNPTGVPPGGLHAQLSMNLTPEPSAAGAPFTANLSVAAPNVTSPIPSGSVSYFLDGVLAGTVPLSSGTASFTFTATLAKGVHQIVAAYDGDAAYSMGSTSAPHTVSSPSFPTSTTLTATPLAALTSQTVHLEATVSAAGGATMCPPSFGALCSWGSVVFNEGTSTLHVARTDPSGQAVFDTVLLSPGAHTITAHYLGFSNDTGIFPQSTSSPVTLTVASTPTTTAATVSNSTVTAGSLVTFTAIVSATSGTPFGSATFFDGATALGTSSLQADGTASFTTASLSAGAHSISARFNTNATFASSSSAAVSVVVQPASAILIPTFSAVSAVLQPAAGTLSLSAVVVAESGSPQGQVVFLDGGAVIGQATINSSGIATLNVPVSGSGQHIFHASFSGDARFAPSVTPDLENTLPGTGGTFAMQVTPATMMLSGGRAEGDIVVSTTGSLSAPVQLICTSGLPSGYSCNFEPSVLSGDGSSHFSITRTVSGRSLPATGERKSRTLLPFAIASTLLLGMIFAPAGRRAASLILLCMMGVGVFSGCGGLQAPVAKIQVITVQAISGVAQARSVQSAQIVLSIAQTER
jgi:hypothetical protein